MSALRFWLAAFFLGLGGSLASSAALACPFCSEERGPTLVGDFAQASMVLFGRMENSRLTSEGDFVTDFAIEQVIKSHDAVKDKKVITLQRNIPPTKSKFLLFCDVYKGAIDPYRGIEVQPGSDMVKYLLGAVQFKDKTAGERLRYCFEYLNNPEYEIAIDSYREFAKEDYKDYMDIAKKLSPDLIASWLRDPKTPPFRYGLYASLLGHCGTVEHAKLLRAMIEDPEKRKGSGIDGMLAAYIMLQPKDGWDYLQTILKDDRQEFLMRYACLRTVRFLWEQRPDLVERKELGKGLTLILDQPDMADFGIEDLRKYKQWEVTDQILDLFGKKSHDIPVVKRAIMRYALQSPQARAVAFVQQQRQRDGEWVKDIEELLKLESQ
jgi:hypothetical protein